MKRIFFLFTLSLIVHKNTHAQCNAGSYTVTGNVMITGSCKITGNLTILNGATLNVDLTSAAAETFVVQGDILLQGNAMLWVHAAAGSTNDQFVVSNSYNNQRTIITKDSSKIMLEYVEFRTQEGSLSSAASFYMNYNAKDRSIFYINKSWLNTQTAWLLCNMNDNSTLIGYEPNRLPTEIYLQDSVQIILHGANTNTGIWLNFESITDTLNLPPNQTQPYTWQIGRGSGGLGTPWHLELDTLNPGLGVQIFPSTKISINGSGVPATGELKVALMFANGTDTIKNLGVGLQNTTIADGLNGSVKLNTVNLGPIAWQLYALMNENLFIKNSIVNEIGIAGPSRVTVDSSLLQLAVLGAVGVGGSTMTVSNSELWNQSITAANSSSLVLNNCRVYGSAFSTTDTLSHITVNGGCFFQNPVGCSPATMVNITSGQPYCNPFIPPGFPQNLTPSTVTFNGVNSTCSTTGINENIFSSNSFSIYPNPVSETLNVSFPNDQKQQLQFFNAMGVLLKEIEVVFSTQISTIDLPNGLYFIQIKGQPFQSQKVIKQ